jgi:hypothetical protein
LMVRFVVAFILTRVLLFLVIFFRSAATCIPKLFKPLLILLER